MTRWWSLASNRPTTKPVFKPLKVDKLRSTYLSKILILRCSSHPINQQSQLPLRGSSKYCITLHHRRKIHHKQSTIDLRIWTKCKCKCSCRCRWKLKCRCKCKCRSRSRNNYSNLNRTFSRKGWSAEEAHRITAIKTNTIVHKSWIIKIVVVVHRSREIKTCLTQASRNSAIRWPQPPLTKWTKVVQILSLLKTLNSSLQLSRKKKSMMGYRCSLAPPRHLKGQRDILSQDECQPWINLSLLLHFRVSWETSLK